MHEATEYQLVWKRVAGAGANVRLDSMTSFECNAYLESLSALESHASRRAEGSEHLQIVRKFGEGALADEYAWLKVTAWEDDESFEQALTSIFPLNVLSREVSAHRTEWLELPDSAELRWESPIGGAGGFHFVSPLLAWALQDDEDWTIPSPHSEGGTELLLDRDTYNGDGWTVARILPDKLALSYFDGHSWHELWRTCLSFIVLVF